jgi:integrase
MGDRLYKRGSVWWGWCFDAHGRRHAFSTRCTDKRAAEVALRERERRVADPTYAATHAATIESALKRLLVDREQRGRALGTLAMYRVKAGHVARVLGAETRLVRVTASVVDGYVDQRLKEGAARNTVQKELVTIRAMLKVAKRRGEFIGDIGAVMPDGFDARYQPRKRFLTAEEAQKLFAELTPDRAARVAFILATGARWGETERACLGDVDLARGTVHLRGTKTEAAARVVPVVAWGNELLEHAEEHAEGTNGALFTPWGSVRRDLAAAWKRANIPAVSPNDLRRTYGTWLRTGGVEPHLIGVAMGHRGSRMVERVYGRMPHESLGATLRQRLGDCSGYVATTRRTESSERPQRQPAPSQPSELSRASVPRAGIEPATRGFSIPVSRLVLKPDRSPIRSQATSPSRASMPQRTRNCRLPIRIRRPRSAPRPALNAAPDAHPVAREAELHLSAHGGRRAVGGGGGDAAAVFFAAVAFEFAAGGVAAVGVRGGGAGAVFGGAEAVALAGFGFFAVGVGGDAAAVFGGAGGAVFARFGGGAVFAGGGDAFSAFRRAEAGARAHAIGVGRRVARACTVAAGERAAFAAAERARSLFAAALRAFRVDRFGRVLAETVVGAAGLRLLAVFGRFAALVGRRDALAGLGTAFSVELAGFGALAVGVGPDGADALRVRGAFAFARARRFGLAGVRGVAAESEENEREDERERLHRRRGNTTPKCLATARLEIW